MPLLIQILLVLIVAGMLYWLVTLLPLPTPFPQIIRVVVIIACILWLISLFWGGFGFGGDYSMHRHWH